MATFLHEDVQLITPLSKLSGKQAYSEAVGNFVGVVQNYVIRAVFEVGEEAFVIYDLECEKPIGIIPSSALLTFQDGRIINNELFHDTNLFQKMRGELVA